MTNITPFTEQDYINDYEDLNANIDKGDFTNAL